MKKKRIISLMLIFSLLLSLLSACAAPGEAGETSGTGETGDTAETTVPAETRPDNELWIVAEVEYADLLDQPVKEIRENHPDLTVTLETIPYSSVEREVFLQQLRVPIMAGEGPDVFLLRDYSSLFQDVTQSMHNGLFSDISGYYDADTELDKDGLVSAVMEAGVLDGARYVLPLRYDISVLYVYVNKLEAAGLEPDSLGDGFSGLNEVIRTMGNESVAIGPHLGNFLMYLFPEAFDYETDNVALTEEEMAEFIQPCKDMLTTLTAPYNSIDYDEYIQRNDYWGLSHGAITGDGEGGGQEIVPGNGASVFLDDLTSLGPNLRIAKATDNELAVLPFRAADGSLAAKITAYGAVSASCDNPGLAYEFLRKFLLEDSQWKKRTEITWELYLNGWPVLSEGSGEVMEKGMWNLITRRNYDPSYRLEGWEDRKEAMASVTLTEEDFSILYEEIDKAYFRPASISDITSKIANRLDPSQNPNAADVDVNEFARELLRDLQMRLAEG